LVVTGVVVGSFSQRLRQDIVVRQRAQRHLALYADQVCAMEMHPGSSVTAFRIPVLSFYDKRPMLPPGRGDSLPPAGSLQFSRQLE
jgi:hypothetical protein